MDYSEWLSHSPFEFSQTEKEKRLLPYFLELTEYHRTHCIPYKHMLDLLNYNSLLIHTLADLPMLPITLFKTLPLKSASDNDFKTLTSSGTSGQAVSQIFLDKATAQNQQLTLYSIVQDFIGSARRPMLIIDSPSIVKNRLSFTARSAAILGFSMFAKHPRYALTENFELDLATIEQFIQDNTGKPVLIFGFTFMIWQYFCLALQQNKLHFDFSNACLIHGGGWKKLQDKAVTPTEYKHRLLNQFGIYKVHNYYGMAEQTGCIYMECEYGHLHASIFSDIIFRQPHDFSICSIGSTGIINVLSPMAISYPGHSILTEDLGTLLGVDDCPCGRKGKYFLINGRIPKAEIRGCSDTHG